MSREHDYYAVSQPRVLGRANSGRARAAVFDDIAQSHIGRPTKVLFDDDFVTINRFHRK